MEENVFTKPDLSGEKGVTDARPVRRKSERLRKLLEKRKHVLRKYETKYGVPQDASKSGI